MNNRYRLSSVLGILFLIPPCSVMPAESLRDKSLTELATELRPGFLIGAHSASEFMRKGARDNKYQQILKREYNLMSVGIYHGQTQRNSRDDWSFAAMDPLINFAQRNGLKVYAHPMYGSNGYIPDWLLNGDYSDEQWLEIIEERIKTILSRYKGRIDILDVYNEGFGRREHGWRKKDNLFLRLGYHENEHGKWPVFLERMLVWCRKYGGEELQLIYNDNHNTLSGMTQSEDCINLHRALKEAGIPIDGIGIQCHTKITEDGRHELSAMPSGTGIPFDARLFARNLKEMGDAGINVHITECDVHLYGRADDEKLRQQAKAYREILKACITAPSCKSFKTWGFTDARCWKPMQKHNRSFKYEPSPLVFDHAMKPKPAYHAMKSLLIELIQQK